MDRINRSLSDPFFLLDELIGNGLFFDYVVKFYEIEESEQLWDVWIHKVLDKSFNEFKNSIIKEEINPEKVGTTIKDSLAILSGFIPE